MKKYISDLEFARKVDKALAIAAVYSTTFINLFVSIIASTDAIISNGTNIKLSIAMVIMGSIAALIFFIGASLAVSSIFDKGPAVLLSSYLSKKSLHEENNDTCKCCSKKIKGDDNTKEDEECQNSDLDDDDHHHHSVNANSSGASAITAINT